MQRAYTDRWKRHQTFLMMESWWANALDLSLYHQLVSNLSLILKVPKLGKLNLWHLKRKVGTGLSGICVFSASLCDCIEALEAYGKAPLHQSVLKPSLNSEMHLLRRNWLVWGPLQSCVLLREILPMLKCSCLPLHRLYMKGKGFLLLFPTAHLWRPVRIWPTVSSSLGFSIELHQSVWHITYVICKVTEYNVAIGI